MSDGDFLPSEQDHSGSTIDSLMANKGIYVDSWLLLMRRVLVVH